MSGPAATPIRYAIYYAPRQEEALSAVANNWLGRTRPRAPVFGVSHERLDEITADPRLYGFHGTLKAPIALGEEFTERDFLDAIGRFAASRRTVVVPSMTLAELGDFLALVPAKPCSDLQDLADACVIEFDEFRRPAGEDELARRRAAGLSPRQEDLLRRWGYPYVLEEWRFHLTLTGRIHDAAERGVVMQALRKRFSGFIDRPLQVRDLCVFRQAGPGRQFGPLARFRLGGGRLVPAEVWRAN